MSEIERLHAQNADLIREAELADELSASLITVCNEAMAMLKRIGDAESITLVDREQCLAAFATWQSIIDRFEAGLKIAGSQSAPTSERIN